MLFKFLCINGNSACPWFPIIPSSKNPFKTSIIPENLAFAGSFFTKLLFFTLNSSLTSLKSGISKSEPSPANKKNPLNVLNNGLLVQ